MNPKHIELRHLKSPDGNEGEITYVILDHKADGTWRTSLELCLERYWHTRGVKRRHTNTIDLKVEDLDHILKELEVGYPCCHQHPDNGHGLAIRLPKEELE